MGSIHNIADVISPFVEYLVSSEDRRGQLKAIATLGHGFEAWMKFELGAWLIRKCHLRPHEDIGFEWKTKMDQSEPGMDKEQKQCDIWINASHEPERYHFIELKLFSKRYQPKVISQAGWDLWYMKHIDQGYEQPQTGNLLVFGFEFESQEEWEETVRKKLTSEAGMDSVAKPAKSGWLNNDEKNGFVNWELWQHKYQNK